MDGGDNSNKTLLVELDASFVSMTTLIVWRGYE